MNLIEYIQLAPTQWSCLGKYHPEIRKIIASKKNNLQASRQKYSTTGQYETNYQSHTLPSTLFFPGCMASQWFQQAFKNVGDLKINSRKILNDKTSTLYCWLYFLTSIVQVSDFLFTPEGFACQQNVWIIHYWGQKNVPTV